jgi:hypothetical protein
MGKRSTAVSLWICLAASGFFLLAASTAWPVEFAAQMVLCQGSKAMPGKIYVKDGKMRQEFIDAEGHTVTIVRRDKKLIWVLLPLEKLYVEMPLTNKLPGQFLQVPPEAMAKRRLGSEKVNGYEADKIEVTLRGGDSGVRKEIYWVPEKLGLPVKMVCRERNLCLEYRDIREGQVAELLFEVPPGYQKQAQPDGRTLRHWD